MNIERHTDRVTQWVQRSDAHATVAIMIFGAVLFSVGAVVESIFGSEGMAQLLSLPLQLAGAVVFLATAAAWSEIISHLSPKRQAVAMSLMAAASVFLVAAMYVYYPQRAREFIPILAMLGGLVLAAVILRLAMRGIQVYQNAE